MDEGKSIDEIILFCKAEYAHLDLYDLSEKAINSFGYQLMNEDRNEDALKIFNLNVSIYPKEFNAYDSLGECLVKLKRIEERMTAYAKSLALNPNNDNAKQVLKKN